MDTPREPLYPLLRQHGWNATAYQIVNPGMAHWFSPEGDAVIGYVTRARVRVVAGAPVCDEARLTAVMADFAREARASGERVCYFGAAGRVFALLSEQAGHSVVVLGAQPVWNPQRLPAWRPSLRAQLSRARNKGVRVREWAEIQALLRRQNAALTCLGGLSDPAGKSAPQPPTQNIAAAGQPAGLAHFGISTVILMVEYQSAKFSMSASVSVFAMMLICGPRRLPDRYARSCSRRYSFC